MTVITKTAPMRTILRVLLVMTFSWNEIHAGTITTNINLKESITLNLPAEDSCLISPGTQAGNHSIVFPYHPAQVITVGGDSADVKGYTSRAIQIAVDALHCAGGGTVKILPGNYEIIAPVKLYSNISLVGSGQASVLRKAKGTRTRFTVDAGYGELQVTVEDPAGFTAGMGVQVYDSKNHDAWDVTTAVVTQVHGHVLHLDSYLIRDYESGREGTVSNSCSVIAAVEAENITITNLAIDGNRETNDLLNGCRGGGIYLHKVRGVRIEKVTVKNFNGDGISWQITEDVAVKDCEISGCLSGLHPGSGTLYTLIEGNQVYENDRDGLFVCWRVKNGIVRNNHFVRNGRFGICTGHMDTDMLFEENQIASNGSDGVRFRHETKANAPHRNIFRKNTVENNGSKGGGYGFSFNSPAEGVILEGNIIRNTKGNSQKAAVLIDKNGLPVIMKNNQVSGHAEGQQVVYPK